MAFHLFRVSVMLLTLVAVLQVHGGTARNPSEFQAPKKTVRGFTFKNYFDFIPTPYVAGPLNADGTKLVVLNGQDKWALRLKINKELFAPTYKFYDDKFEMHESNIQNCYYHGEVVNVTESFIAVSDCNGINGMLVYNSIDKYSIHTLENNEGIIIVKENNFWDGMGYYDYTTIPSPINNAIVRSRRDTDQINTVNTASNNPQIKKNNVQNNVKTGIEKIKIDVPVLEKSPANSNNVLKEVKPIIPTSITNANTNKNINPNNRIQPTKAMTDRNKENSNTKKKVNTDTATPNPDASISEKCREFKLRERRKLVKASRGHNNNINFRAYNLDFDQPCTAEQLREIHTASSRQLKKRDATSPSAPKYYDASFTLAHMSDITDDAQAEQYMADIANMLQQYYKHHYFNGHSVRLSGTHYLRQHVNLVSFNELDENDPGKSYFIAWSAYARAKKFANTHIKFLFSRPPRDANINELGWGNVNGNCNYASANGLTILRGDSLTNPYEIVTTMVHEIGHITGIDHTDKYKCQSNNKWTVMNPYRSTHIQWYDFSYCSLLAMRCHPSSFH